MALQAEDSDITAIGSQPGSGSFYRALRATGAQAVDQENGRWYLIDQSLSESVHNLRGIL